MSLLKRSAVGFGIVFLVVGILGFVPGITKNQMLLGIFHVNVGHNIVHLVSGIIAVACGMSSPPAWRHYFQVFGIVYGLVAILGLIQGNTNLLGFISNNMADVWLHFAIAISALALGFGVHARTSEHEAYA